MNSESRLCLRKFVKVNLIIRQRLKHCFHFLGFESSGEPLVSDAWNRSWFELTAWVGQLSTPNFHNRFPFRVSDGQASPRFWGRKRVRLLLWRFCDVCSVVDIPCRRLKAVNALDPPWNVLYLLCLSKCLSKYLSVCFLHPNLLSFL